MSISSMPVGRDTFGRFVKGIIPWNKGKTGVYTFVVLQKMRDGKKGKHMSLQTEFKKGRAPWNRGVKGVLKANKTSFKKGHTWCPEIQEKQLSRLREKALLQPNLIMSEDLAYVLGMLKGDGCVFPQSRSYSIVLDITDPIIANNFYCSLQHIGLNPWIKERMPTNGVGKLKKYIVHAYSLLFGQWYKDLTLQQLETLLDNASAISAFVRGFYEAEGNLYIDKKYQIPSLHLHNTDKQLLDFVALLCQKLGLFVKYYGPYKNTGHLSRNQKFLYRITFYNRNAYNFLKVVKPTVKTIKRVETLD